MSNLSPKNKMVYTNVLSANILIKYQNNIVESKLPNHR